MCVFQERYRTIPRGITGEKGRERESENVMITNTRKIVAEQAAEKVYRYMTAPGAEHWGMNFEQWDWVPGVGLISVLDYADHTGKQEPISFLQEWTSRHTPRSDMVINGVAPFAIFPKMYKLTGDKKFLQWGTRYADWLIEQAPRTREGAFEHTVTEGVNFSEQVWADTVFMAVLFLTRQAKLENNETYAQEALRQLSLHLRLLQDAKTGVLFHGWNCETGNHMSGARWTRANAWIALATPEITKELVGWVDIPTEISEMYNNMMSGLLAFQAENGLWHTVMDEPTFYYETSGSAGIAAGMLRALRMGLLQDEAYAQAAERTVDAVLEQIQADGEVTGVSGGTAVLPAISRYNSVPCFPTLYGQGLALMLLATVLDETNRGDEINGERSS